MMNFRIALMMCVMAVACGDAPDATKAVDADGKVDGAQLYGMYCTLCHGEDGALGINGAKNLGTSALSREEVIGVVTFGRNTMVGYGRTLDGEQIEAVVDHVMGLRKAP